MTIEQEALRQRYIKKTGQNPYAVINNQKKWSENYVQSLEKYVILKESQEKTITKYLSIIKSMLKKSVEDRNDTSFKNNNSDTTKNSILRM